MKKMKMSDILEESSLVFNCWLAVNELILNVTALLNTDTEGEAFIHKRHLDFVIKWLHLYVRTAQRSVSLTDYNNQNSEVIFRVFTVNLMIDERQISIHFLFCNTGRHNILIERKWFKKTKVLIDYFNQKLIWPEKTQYQISKNLIVSKQEIQLSKLILKHQADAEQQNSLHETVTLTQILRRTENNSHQLISQMLRKSALQLWVQSKTWRAQQQINTDEMKRQLNKKNSSMNKSQDSLNVKKIKNSKSFLYQGVSITLLKADNFLHNVRREEVVIEATSIHEINCLIENWRNLCLLLQDEAELNQMIKKKLSH